MSRFLLVKLKRSLAGTLTLLGRAIEYALTGQSDYRFGLGEAESFKTVENDSQGKMLLKEVSLFLEQRFAIKITEPVMLLLFSPAEFSWNSCCYRFSGLQGRYRPCYLKEQRTHLIYLLKGLPPEKFKAVLAHELTHAFQRENAILSRQKGLREGMARWIEYKVLLNEGEKSQAKKLTGLKSWLSGKGIKKILELEQKLPEEQIIPYLSES